MVGVDLGSSLTKWFDGERFGTGFPKSGALSVGVTSKGVLVKFSTYPLCKGRNLEKIIVNEIEVETGVPSNEFSVAYCPVEKVDTGCKFLIFVEKKSRLEGEIFEEARHVTVDVVGMLAATSHVYGRDFTGTVVDAGMSKICVLKLEKGKPSSVEIIRIGFDSILKNRELIGRFREAAGERFILVGGGALDEDFTVFLSKENFEFEVPNFPPFGDLTPLYYNSFGLWRFRFADCKADFKRFRLLNSEVLSKYKRELTVAAVSLLVSLLLLTVGEFLRFSAAKKEYQNLDRAIKTKLSEVTGIRRVVAPKIQLKQSIENLERKAQFFMVDTPSVLVYVNNVSSSVVKGVKVLSLKVSVTDSSAEVSGLAENRDALDRFRQELVKKFKKVAVSTTKEVSSGVKFTIKLQGVRVES